MLFFVYENFSSAEHSLSSMYKSGLRPLETKMLLNFVQASLITAAALDFNGSASMALLS